MSRSPRASERVSHERFEERVALVAGERRRRRLVLLLAAAVLGLLVYVVGFSPLLSVREVRVVGADPMDRAAITADAAPALGTPLARVDTAAIGDAVGARPGVKSVSVERSWPRGLTVDVVPRVPALAVQKSKGQVEVYDLSGVKMRTVPTAPEGVPTITASGGASLTAEGVAAARAMLGALPSDLRATVRSVSVDAADQVTFQVGRTTVIWGDATDPERKVAVARVLLEKRPRTLDVSAPDTPVTR